MNPSPESTSSIDNIGKLIKKLAEQFDLTGKEIADVLWLALELQKRENQNLSKGEELTDESNNSQPFSPEEEVTNQSNNLQPSQTKKKNLKQQQGDNLEEQKSSIYSSTSVGEGEGISIGVPDAPSLREPLKFAREFRPIMRQVATGRNIVLDEIATVNRIAEELVYIPVLKSEDQLWLDLALIIDESHSMLIWRNTIEELTRMFKSYGIFRDVRVWGLQSEDEGRKIQLFSRTGNNKRLAESKEIIDPTGRRVVLIVSDCVSSIWRKGTMLPLLQSWTEKQPLAILQMLPEWMWRRSALNLGTPVGFKSSIVGIVNKELSLHKPLRRIRIRRTAFQIEEQSKVPVINLNGESINQWSQMLIGKGDARVAGYLLPTELKAETREIDRPLIKQKQEKPIPEEIVDNFRWLSSPLSRKLAGLFAASPVITLPIVRLIQQTLLPKSDQIQVAEVFLGGLLKPKESSIQKLKSEVNINPDLVEYEFIYPEIRDIFIEDAPVSDSVDVINAVSRYIAEQLGLSMTYFLAMLRGETKTVDKDKEERIKPFAE
ncbi:MAG: SAV_2336 N-terminal domain-related protein, partial [Xenococcaceae cyanobacterium MO_167.B52]|nr:SAV_2336 N-terminal domain-related protein [Xenococcaceae cyanobacterium MO_167.B52]